MQGSGLPSLLLQLLVGLEKIVQPPVHDRFVEKDVSFYAELLPISCSVLIILSAIYFVRELTVCVCQTDKLIDTQTGIQNTTRHTDIGTQAYRKTNIKPDTNSNTDRHYRPTNIETHFKRYRQIQRQPFEHTDCCRDHTSLFL